MNPWVNAGYQICIFIGAIYLVGFLIALINRLFYHIAGATPGVVYGTGFIGTPIHELSHALFCLIFMHKIHEIKLFQIDDSGVLGYVSHSWNRKNLYATIGNFFIGVAPILVGTAFLILLMFWITPSTFNAINGTFAVLTQDLAYDQIPSVIGKSIGAFFKGASDFRWWIYIFIVMFIAIHMNLSRADLKGTLVGMPFLLLLIVLVNIVIGYIFKPAYAGYLNFMAHAGVYLCVILFMSLVFSLISLILAFIIRFFKKIFHRI